MDNCFNCGGAKEDKTCTCTSNKPWPSTTTIRQRIEAFRRAGIGATEYLWKLYHEKRLIPIDEKGLNMRADNIQYAINILADAASNQLTEQDLDNINEALRIAGIIRDPRPVNNISTLNEYAANCHKANAKWWHDIHTGKRLERNKGELLCLIHSEISEAMEAERKSLMDDKLPHRRGAEVELADALIRIFDYAAAFGYDLDGAFWDKMAYNATRADHSHAERIKEGGKKW